MENQIAWYKMMGNKWHQLSKQKSKCLLQAFVELIGYQFSLPGHCDNIGSAKLPMNKRNATANQMQEQQIYAGRKGSHWQTRCFEQLQR